MWCVWDVLSYFELLQILGRSFQRFIDLAEFGAVALSGSTFDTSLATNDTGHRIRPVFGGNTSLCALLMTC